MLSGLVAASEKTQGNRLPRLDLSRCLLARNSNSTCARCQDACTHKAINLQQRPLAPDSERCRGCLACTRECRTGALSLPTDNLRHTLASLDRQSHLVVSCTKNFHCEAQIKIPCLGGLPEELLVALLAASSAPITVDLSLCRNCDRGEVAGRVEEMVQKVARIFPAETAGGRLTVCWRQSALPSPAQERRAFFRSLRDMAVSGSRSLLAAEQQGREPAFSRKQVPEPRLLLQDALTNASAAMAALIAEHYFYTLYVVAACNLCGACAGVCPSGALRVSRSETGRTLDFLPKNCTGCGACREICRQTAMHLAKGATLEGIGGHAVHQAGPL